MQHDTVQTIRSTCRGRQLAEVRHVTSIIKQITIRKKHSYQVQRLQRGVSHQSWLCQAERARAERRRKEKLGHLCYQATISCSVFLCSLEFPTCWEEFYA